jgi:hypothetical protein
MRQKIPKQDDVQLLVNTAMSWAEAKLLEEGEISAAAAWLPLGSAQPQFRPACASQPGHSLSISRQEELLTVELREPWRRGELAAVLLMAPVLYGRTGSGERTEAVRLHVEAGQDYCADILMPYRIRTTGRWYGRPKNRVHFSQPVAQESDSRFSDLSAPA